MTKSSTQNKFFINKKFYFHLTRINSAQKIKSAELIKIFGGQIDEFLDHEISYVLTDIPKSSWPPNGDDEILLKAKTYKVKIMSLHDLRAFCFKYVTSQSSSDEDDETEVNLKAYIKFEPLSGTVAPTMREFNQWPEPNFNVTIGRSIFSDGIITPNNSTQTTAVRRRCSIYCDICALKVNESVEEHIKSPAHQLNTEKLSWTDVQQVISSLPSLSTLNKRRISDLKPPEGSEQTEFICLHKVESVSQLFDKP